MNYLKEINAFERYVEANFLPPAAQLMWYKLIALFNRCGWPDWVTLDNIRLMTLCGMRQEKTCIKTRDFLILHGMIRYRRGRKGFPSRYGLVPSEGWGMPREKGEETGRERSEGGSEGRKVGRERSEGGSEGRKTERERSEGGSEGRKTERERSEGRSEGRKTERERSEGGSEGRKVGRERSEGGSEGRKAERGRSEGGPEGRKAERGRSEGGPEGRKAERGRSEGASEGRKTGECADRDGQGSIRSRDGRQTLQNGPESSDAGRGYIESPGRESPVVRRKEGRAGPAG